MTKRMEIPDLFIGPLPEDVYKAVTKELGLFRQDRAVELAARALYGQQMANQALSDAEDENQRNMTDLKTGVLTDRFFRDFADKALLGLSLGRREQDRDNSALVFTFDVVDFGEINRIYGHPGGDLRLRATGDFLSDIIRAEGSDLVGRIGGDEFAMVIFFDRHKTDYEEILREIEDRIANPTLEKYKYLPALRWNHSFFTGNEDIQELLRVSDVKGEPKDRGVVRAHSQTPDERQAAFDQSLAQSLSLLQ
ncbi:MAG TPA: diguanylate cyclase [Candidatus Saccharimonadales bacterium]|nr:diguanylate cyclase [Candidatus Saccharimonadales bacterium]